MGETPTVVGLLGAPRSGSTIVATHIAQELGGIHVGELHLIWDRLASARLCGCGELVRHCSFWTRVWSRVEGSDIVESVDEARRLWDDAVRVRRLLRPPSPVLVLRFRELMEATYRAVADLARVRVVVDSSKHPGYFRALAGSSLDLRAVQLVRDPRAVAYSWSVAKPDRDRRQGVMERRQPALVAADWIALNLLSAHVGRRFEHFSRARYEDVVRDGTGPLIDQLDLEPTRVEDRTWGHTVAGNPVRHDDAPAALALDRRWVEAMPALSRATVSMATMPLLIAYGYPLRPR